MAVVVLLDSSSLSVDVVGSTAPGGFQACDVAVTVAEAFGEVEPPDSSVIVTWKLA